MAKELKNCPFCGGDAEIMQEFDFTEWVVFCLCCGCSLESAGIKKDGTGKKFKSKKKARKGWNKRV